MCIRDRCETSDRLHRAEQTCDQADTRIHAHDGDPSGKFFAKMDAVHGYFQLGLDEESSRMTTFLVVEGVSSGKQ